MPVSLSILAGAGWQFFDDNGTPLTGGKLYTYIAGTTTLATTYTDSSGATANTNPIVLNSAGRVPYEIWLNSGTSYKFILKTSTNTLIGTYDNIKSTATSLDGTGVNNAVTYFNATGAFTSNANFTFNDATNALSVTGNISGNNLTAGGTLSVTGNSTLGGTLAVTGNTTVTGTIASTGGITSATPAVTQVSNDNSTKIATTAFVQAVAQNDKIQPLTASKDGSSNLNISLAPTSITFRSDTLSSGTTTLVSNSSTLNLQVPSGASLGATIGNTARLIVLAVYNGTNMQLAVTNSENGNQLDETNLITTTTTGATATAIYSGSTVSNKPYRIVGFIDIVLGLGSAWSNDPTTVQGSGGVAMVKVPALVTVQSQVATGASVDFTVPITAKRITLSFYETSSSATSPVNWVVQIGYGSPETTGYTSVSMSLASGTTGGTATSTSGFVINANSNTYQISGHMVLTNIGNNLWVESHAGTYFATNGGIHGGGRKSVTTGVTIVRITRDSGTTQVFDNGYIGLMYE